MTRQNDYRKTIQRVSQEASAARAFFHTWNELNLAHGEPRLRSIINDYNYIDFFRVSIDGNFRLMFLSLSGLFDKKNKALSLGKVAESLRSLGHYILAEDIDGLHMIHNDTIKSVVLVRNKFVAHNDPKPLDSIFADASITPNAIRELIDAVCVVLNKVRRELGFPDRISDGARNRRAIKSLLNALASRYQSTNDAT